MLHNGNDTGLRWCGDTRLMPGSYAPGYAGSPSYHSLVQFYARTVTSARFRTNGISPATRHRPEIRNPSAESYVRVKSGPHRLEFGWCPAHLGLPHLFSHSTHRRKKLPETTGATISKPLAFSYGAEGLQPHSPLSVVRFTLYLRVVLHWH